MARRAPPRPLSRDRHDARSGRRSGRRERRHDGIAGGAGSPVPSLEPAKTAALWQSLVAQQPQAGAFAGGVPSASRRVLRRVGLASPRHQARRRAIGVRRVLRLRSAARGGQDHVPARPGVADQSARAELPRHGGDSLHDLVAVGRLHGQLVVHRRRHRPRAHGRGRLRRHEGRHVGAQRADDRGPAWRRQRAGERPGVPPRTVRGRRQQADTRHRPHRRLRSAHERPDRLPEHPSELARGQRVLDGHGDVRQRLVAGGLRRPPRTRGSG